MTMPYPVPGPERIFRPSVAIIFPVSVAAAARTAGVSVSVCCSCTVCAGSSCTSVTAPVYPDASSPGNISLFAGSSGPLPSSACISDTAAAPFEPPGIKVSHSSTFTMLPPEYVYARVVLVYALLSQTNWLLSSYSYQEKQSCNSFRWSCRRRAGPLRPGNIAVVVSRVAAARCRR